jgi:hypothetical protein
MVDIENTINELTADIEHVGRREARIIAHIQAQVTTYNSGFLTEGQFQKRFQAARIQLESDD